MTYDNFFHMAFYCAALLVCLTTFIFTKVQKRIGLPQNRYFLMMNYFVFFNALTCFLNEIFDAYKHSFKVFYWLLLISQFLYFLIHIALPAVLFNYVTLVTETITFRAKSIKFVTSIPLIIALFLVITNPLTRFVYYYDENLNFHRNWAEILIYLIALGYVVFAFANLMASWNALRKRNRWSLIYLFVITIIGLVAQYFFIGIKSELFCESLALVGIMLSVENEYDRLDPEIGVYNRNALKMDMEHLLTQKYVVSVIWLKITNIDVISRITGIYSGDEIIREVSDYLKTIVPSYTIYRTDNNTVVILVRQDKLHTGNNDPLRISEIINERFKYDWVVRGVPIKLSPAIAFADVPTHIQTLKELLYMVDSPMPDDIAGSVLTANDLEFLIRRAAVESSVSNGLSEKKFEVYYQPTHCTGGLKIHGAEALIRLHDDKLGMIFPDEFIPIAEQTGNIDDIDDFVLAEVCAFIKSGEPAKLGMDCINVNLSVIQCMRDDFVKHILDIVESFDIPKSFINFEITESVAASDYEFLNTTISDLKKNGFQFSMDDYGTGYSNMHSLFSLDFDIVKIDKSILWDAENSERGQIILESCVHMIKQMKRKILVEGVETRKQVEKLEKLGVDYLQGYYFSKPITKREILAYGK